MMDDIKIDCPKAPEYFKMILTAGADVGSGDGGDEEKTKDSLSDEDKSKIRRRVENAVKELASNASNLNDSTLDVKELRGMDRDSAQTYAIQVILEWYIQSSPGKDTEAREKVSELLINLVKGNVVTKSNANAAVELVTGLLPDVKIDCPMAPKFFGEVMKKCFE